jgi:hypothetical protein
VISQQCVNNPGSVYPAASELQDDAALPPPSLLLLTFAHLFFSSLPHTRFYAARGDDPKPCPPALSCLLACSTLPPDVSQPAACSTLRVRVWCRPCCCVPSGIAVLYTIDVLLQELMDHVKGIADTSIISTRAPLAVRAAKKAMTEGIRSIPRHCHTAQRSAAQVATAKPSTRAHTCSHTCSYSCSVLLYAPLCCAICAVYAGLGMTPDTAAAADVSAFGDLFATEDVLEGCTAFVTLPGFFHTAVISFR